MEVIINNFNSEQKLFVICLKSLLSDHDKRKHIKDLRIMENRLCEYILQLDEMVLVTRETRKPVILRIQNLQENVDLVLESFAESTEHDIAEIDRLKKNNDELINEVIVVQEKYIKLSEEHAKMQLTNQRLRNELTDKIGEIEKHKNEIIEIRRKLLELANANSFI
jgi:hypothetical protein